MSQKDMFKTDSTSTLSRGCQASDSQTDLCPCGSGKTLAACHGAPCECGSGKPKFKCCHSDEI